MVFVLTHENASSWRIYFKTNVKTSGFSKKLYQEFFKYCSDYEFGMFLSENQLKS